jgi:hypothetical protein
MASVTSSALAFSWRLAPDPFHWYSTLPVSRMNTSPLFSDPTATGTTM